MIECKQISGRVAWYLSGSTFNKSGQFNSLYLPVNLCRLVTRTGSPRTQVYPGSTTLTPFTAAGTLSVYIRGSLG